MSTVILKRLTRPTKRSGRPLAVGETFHTQGLTITNTTKSVWLVDRKTNKKKR